MQDSDEVIKLSKDLRQASKTLSAQEARYLVDMYYTMQDNRIRADGKIRALSENPHQVLSWASEKFSNLETVIKTSLGVYAYNDPLGKWALGQYGIGPVLAAGLLAHIDIAKAPTAGHVWSYAGLVEGKERKAGKKLEYNPDLKKLCWLIGQSFLKFYKRPECFYGQIYLERKTYMLKENEAGRLAHRAAKALATKNFSRDTETKKTYESGKLPPAHLDADARRVAVKMFLSHYHEIGYELLHKTKPPVPYAIGILGHDKAHYIAPPAPREV
jgi:hypothetical protein